MNKEDVKNTVQSYYAEIAINGRQSCCSAESSCCDHSELIQLSEYGTVPEADLGLSCGLPTQYANIQSGETVLDLGSGAGVDVFRAARLTGPSGRVIGVDMTPEMITRAQENALRGGYMNVEFRLGDIEDLPVDNESVDVVLSNCVINLAPDKKQVFKEIFRVLTNGGRFIVSDIVTYGEVPVEIRQDMTLWASCIAGAVDQEEYLGIIRECGFNEVVMQQRVDYNKARVDPYGIASITVQATKTTPSIG